MSTDSPTWRDRIGGWFRPREQTSTQPKGRRGSIAAALFLLSAGWLIVALVATAFLLTELYSRALDNSLVETLEFHVETLTDLSLLSESPKSDQISVADPRFDRTGSGWYWAIRAEDGELLNFSNSYVGMVLGPLPGPFDSTNAKTAVVTDPFGTKIRVIERAVTVNGVPLHIMVTGSLDEILSLVDEFRGQTLIVLGAVAIMLAVMSTIVARLALRPIGRLRREVERVREGDAPSVTGSYPAEIAPLSEEINELLRANAQIVERARNQVGNLAHGLKTPIAVLRNEAVAHKSNLLAKVVSTETEKMSQLVTTYLDRARLAARSAVVGKKADATHVMLRLTRVMQKLNPRVTIAMVRPDASLPWFRGDEGDLEEMAGNLLDNACKWAKSSIGVTVVAERRDGTTNLLIKVDDDGPGLTEEEATKVLRRGVRLDEKTPGSGLGLDIVKELVDVYGGSLQLKRSVLGGLLAELRLPAAKVAGFRTFASIRKE
ncbi:HAMP domain-containing sensor histidine kinase [Devosia sp. ZB163]|uniref:sensor histidine kinase n=1 Tax=Devosia sp. ZB163 TaxID=3025938 RepID=UPI0023620EBC|nr:HAMP domain-containing sensor histidine kinase [Devosia sp. ZB163]MDC9823839.1 HAMP domain-containing sensor histidine kinase [Devosia sp. ZB163]